MPDAASTKAAAVSSRAVCLAAADAVRPDPSPCWLWYPQGSVASGVLVDGARIQFADLNNDGRADYLDVNPQNGGTRAWINYG